MRAAYDETEQTVVRMGEVTERVLGEYPEASLGRVTSAERSALEEGHTTNVGNVIVVPVNTGYEIEDVQAVRLAENFSMLAGNRVPDGAVVAAAFCFREPSFQIHQAEDMVIRWGYPIGIKALEAPADGAAELTCPSCGAATEIPADECGNCGFDGAPFTLPPAQQRQVPSGPPIAITLNVDGQSVSTTGRDIGSYVWVTCPECGLVQDATHEHCSRCGHDLTAEVKKLTGDPNRPPEKHLVAPPPASKQPDKRSAPV